jgi:3-deoxy-D-manno-octulosonate 8-phosphate phosphatase KdsC-like HAD superfamily phosphatase
MTAAPAEIPVLSSIAEVGARYKVWLVDIWGVMHDGMRAHRSAVESTKAFRAQNGIAFGIDAAGLRCGFIGGANVKDGR